MHMDCRCVIRYLQDSSHSLYGLILVSNTLCLLWQEAYRWLFRMLLPYSPNSSFSVSETTIFNIPSMEKNDKLDFIKIEDVLSMKVSKE